MLFLLPSIKVSFALLTPKKTLEVFAYFSTLKRLPSFPLRKIGGDGKLKQILVSSSF